MHAPKPTVTNARRLRKEMTPPEVRLWFVLRRGGVDGFKFRRQHPVGPYVLDFFCAAARLDVEIDGYDHCINGRPERDARRDQWLLDQGIRTLRIPAHDVMQSLDGVLAAISARLGPNHPPPPGAVQPQSTQHSPPPGLRPSSPKGGR